MRCKIVRTQKLMWRNIMRSIKSKKISTLHYSIDGLPPTNLSLYTKHMASDHIHM